MQDTAIPKKMYGKLYATRRRGMDDVSTDLRKMGINEWIEQGIVRLGGVLSRRPRPTPGCSATEEEEEEEEDEEEKKKMMKKKKKMMMKMI